MKHLGLLSLMLLFVGCGGGTTTDNATATGLSFTAAADFTTSGVANLAKLAKTTTGQCTDLDEPITNDEPVLTDGLDCDEDLGIVAHLTPSKYSLAFKRVTLTSADGGADIDTLVYSSTLQGIVVNLSLVLSANSLRTACQTRFSTSPRN